MKEKLLKIYGLIFAINESTDHSVQSTLIDRSFRIAIYKNGYSKVKHPIQLCGRLDDKFVRVCGADSSINEIIECLENLLNEGEK